MVSVEVEGRVLSLSNLDKVLYPATGFTKGEVVDYYSRVAPVLLAHLAERPLTVIRYPDGVEGSFFFEKNAPAHRPGWVRTARLPAPGSRAGRSTIDYLVLDELAALVWVANLAGLELHVPQWRLGQPPDLLVVDLDPGPPATVVECARVALLVRERLGERALVKTSGSKGLQVYLPVAPGTDTSAEARALAERLEREHPDLVVSRMAKQLRPGKVLLDWSQNNPAKTTVCVYSLRARSRPTVSTPVSWQEVASCRDAEDLVFTAADVLDRLQRDGDLFAPLLPASRAQPSGEEPSPASNAATSG